MKRLVRVGGGHAHVHVQATMFFLDSDGYALGFKAFTQPEEVFARQSPP